MKNKLYPWPVNRSVFRQGLKDAIPIGLGYLAVSFSLGINASQGGLTALQSALASFLCLASAGQKAGFDLIIARAAVAELVIVSLVVNARYLLMSCALAQRADPALPTGHRMLMSWAITDEIFAIAIARPGYINPYYLYGAMTAAIPGWTLGTFLGATAGSLLPEKLVGALALSLYGMFLAVIIPEAKKNRVVAWLIVICFCLSFGTEYALGSLSAGTRMILLTVVISAAAAALFPRKEETA